MVSHGPHGRQFRSTGKIGICLYYLGYFRAIEKVIVHFPSLCPKTGYVSPLMCKVELSFKRIVEKNAISLIGMKSDKERDGLIEWILVLTISVLIGNPIAHALSLKVAM